MLDEALPFRHEYYIHSCGTLGKKELYFENDPNPLRTFLSANKIVGLLVDNYTYHINQTSNITHVPNDFKG